MKSVKEPVGIEEYSGNGERILIVDNVEAQRDIAINLLEKLDYNVKAVVSGEEALEYMRNKPIDFTQQEISNYMILMDNIQNMFSMVIEEQFSFKIDDLRVYLVELCH